MGSHIHSPRSALGGSHTHTRTHPHLWEAVVNQIYRVTVCVEHGICRVRFYEIFKVVNYSNVLIRSYENSACKE